MNESVLERVVSEQLDQILGALEVGDILREAVRVSGTQAILGALGTAALHGDLTLEELCGQHDLLKSRFDEARGYLRENLAAPRLFVDEEAMLAAVQETLGKGVTIPKKTIVEKRDEFLEHLKNHLRLSSRWSVRAALDGIHLCEEENSALRRNLAWVAAQPEVTLETRRELSRRIRAWGGPTSVGNDSTEDEAAELLRYQQIAERVCDLAQEAVEAGVREAPSLDDPLAVRADYEAHNRGRVSYQWTSRMDTALTQLRPFTAGQAPPSGTLAEIRALTEREKPRGT